MSGETPDFLRFEKDGISVFVRLTPKSAKDELSGVAQDSDGRLHLKVRVRAVPEDGKANKALVALLAKSLGMPRGAVAIASGHTSRLKTLALSGDGDVLASRLRHLVDESSR